VLEVGAAGVVEWACDVELEEVVVARERPVEFGLRVRVVHDADPAHGAAAGSGGAGACGAAASGPCCCEGLTVSHGVPCVVRWCSDRGGSAAGRSLLACEDAATF
jgi:hypothetical protein